MKLLLGTDVQTSLGSSASLTTRGNVIDLLSGIEAACSPSVPKVDKTQQPSTYKYVVVWQTPCCTNAWDSGRRERGNLNKRTARFVFPYSGTVADSSETTCEAWEIGASTGRWFSSRYHCSVWVSSQSFDRKRNFHWGCSCTTWWPETVDSSGE